MSNRIKKINTYIIGWIGYYRLADTRSVFQALDEWLRRRLRMCYLKQWKKPKTKKSKLVALGIPPEWASPIGLRVREQSGFLILTCPLPGI
ncbi:MAG: hypothetical protein M1119_06105 [Firmicutes bacterium]|nr:hypothetical protein [Bacillota bacterium]